MSRTDAPVRAAAMAAVEPAEPEPTTMTSAEASNGADASNGAADEGLIGITSLRLPYDALRTARGGCR